MSFPQSPRASLRPSIFFAASLGLALINAPVCLADVGVGAKPLPGADVIIDGTRATLDEKWTYWEGPRFGSSLPIKWKIVEDPLGSGTVVQSDDPAVDLGKYGVADIVTKKAYRDFRLHIEFMVMSEGGNSGVYLQIPLRDSDSGRGCNQPRNGGCY